MQLRATAKIFICATLALAASCSAYQAHEESRPENVMKVETRLVQAGFRRVGIETPEQNGAVEQLPLHRLNRYDSVKGSVYWYADPTVCKCLYSGDQQDYMHYVGIVEQENDTAEYMNDTQPYQVAYLSPFGENFPPPTMFGAGWPVLIVVPRPIGVIHPVGGGGGGPIHMHGPGGGPHGIGGHGGGHR